MFVFDAYEPILSVASPTPYTSSLTSLKGEIGARGLAESPYQNRR